LKCNEVIRIGDRAASYGVGSKKMTEGYAYVMPLRALIAAAVEECKQALGAAKK
jgi:hypothetical protein